MHVFSVLVSVLMHFSFIFTCRSNSKVVEQYEAKKSLNEKKGEEKHKMVKQLLT